jgi:hypothetical protein
LYHNSWRIARKYGYRSNLEMVISDKLKSDRVKFKYETTKIEWEDIAYRTYTPDFILNNGIIIEVKGRFTIADRRKHVLVRKQHPNLDIRFVFENSQNKIRKGSKTTYAMWCIKNNFRYYDRIIPEDWIKEKGKDNHPIFIHHKNSTVKRRAKK